MVIDYKRIGRNIRVYRKAKKMTQQQLAERLGCSVEHLSHIENGSRRIKFEALVLICEILQVSLEDILSGGTTIPIAGSTKETESKGHAYGEQFELMLSGYSPETAKTVLQICQQILSMLRD